MIKLAVFDFNGTIFSKETIPFLIDCWNEFGYSKIRLYSLYIKIFPLIIKYKYPFFTNHNKEYLKAEFMYRFAEIFKKMKKDKIDSYFYKVEIKAKQYYNDRVIKQLINFKDKDYQTILLSGAFLELLKQVSINLGFDKVIGSTIISERDKSNEMSVLSGSKKLKALLNNYDKNNIDWDNSYAYADSIDDLELLKAVGHPVVVDPDQRLENIAKNKGWQVIK
ncbi:MAG: haloacid dehalogenase-like hydrolase [Halanaerobiales bacterium]|nr:haloacid dehalogenase-like hydrolase [Halanaerobiales bacterium]